MFSKLNFIIPLNNTDKVLKLRNNNNIVQYIIKEPTCTLKQIDVNISIKQNAESSLIILNFNTLQDAQDAHILLRNALRQLAINLGLTPGSNITSIGISNDFKYASPITTTTNGQNAGISPLIDIPIDNVDIFVNGLHIIIGDGCTATTFLSPTWEALWCTPYSIVSNTTNTITLNILNNNIITISDSIIVTDNGVIKCFNITSITGNVITINGSFIGTVTTAMKPKNFGNVNRGDVFLWFGSYAGYQLDSTTDIIALKYLTNI